MCAHGSFTVFSARISTWTILDVCLRKLGAVFYVHMRRKMKVFLEVSSACEQDCIGHEGRFLVSSECSRWRLRTACGILAFAPLVVARCTQPSVLAQLVMSPADNFKHVILLRYQSQLTVRICFALEARTAASIAPVYMCTSPFGHARDLYIMFSFSDTLASLRIHFKVHSHIPAHYTI